MFTLNGYTPMRHSGTCIHKEWSTFSKLAYFLSFSGSFSRESPQLQWTLTVQIDADTTEETDVARYRYCYCQEDKEGQMIGCDNSLCKYEWFHFQCLGLFCKPKSKKWYCPDCRKLPEFRRKSTKKSKADS